MAEQAQGTVSIAAPAEAILAVVADVEAYPVWSEEFRSATVLTRNSEGRPIKAQFDIDAGPIHDNYTLKYSWDSESRVSWKLLESKVMNTLDGAYELTPRQGATEVTYTLTAELKYKLPGFIMRKARQRIVDGALSGLKLRVESQ
jgi:ribosome-associated toxin RatA of RatAB toxin-antitoxin module